jgi:tryptophan-rich sensory protein
MSQTLSALLFVVVCSAISLVVLGLVRRSNAIKHLDTHHEAAGFLIGIIGVVYAVLLAFTVIIVWEQFTEASHDVAQESNQIEDLWQMAGGFRPEVRDAMRGALVGYARAVVDTEWATMREGRPSAEARQAYLRIWEVFRGVDPQGEREKALYSEVLYTVNVLSDSRRTRLLDSEDSLPPVMWAALYAGGFITIAFTYLFQLRNYRLQAAMTVGVVAVVSLALYLVIALNQPFTGIVTVDSEPFRQLLVRMGS